MRHYLYGRVVVRAILLSLQLERGTRRRICCFQLLLRPREFPQHWLGGGHAPHTHSRTTARRTSLRFCLCSFSFLSNAPDSDGALMERSDESSATKPSTRLPKIAGGFTMTLPGSKLCTRPPRIHALADER